MSRRYDCRGRAIRHPRILDLNTGDLYDTYVEAADAIGGTHDGVYRVCMGTRDNHHGHRYILVEDPNYIDESWVEVPMIATHCKYDREQGKIIFMAARDYGY